MFCFELGGLSVFGAVEAVHGAHNDENSEGDDEEINDVLDEIAVSDVGDGVGTEDVGDVNGQGREVEAAGEEAGDGHDDVIDKGFDDGGEGATNGDTDGEIHDAAAVDEFAKFFKEVAVFEFLDKGLVVHRGIITYCSFFLLSGMAVLESRHIGYFSFSSSSSAIPILRKRHTSYDKLKHMDS